MLDAMLDIFGVILGPKVRGWMDKMASWAGAGRFYVWTRSSPINLGQVDVWTGSVGGAEFFFQNVGSTVQKYSNLAHGKFQNSNQPEVGSMFGQIWATGRKVGGHFGQKCPNFENFAWTKMGGFGKI